MTYTWLVIQYTGQQLHRLTCPVIISLVITNFLLGHFVFLEMGGKGYKASEPTQYYRRGKIHCEQEFDDTSFNKFKNLIDND